MRVRETASLSESQIATLVAAFEETYWAADRTERGVRSMLDDTDVVVALEDAETGALVAFARVLTDFTYRALVEDVIVVPEYRGEGYGGEIVELALDDPRLADVDSVTLGCERALVPFYERFGFEPLAPDMAVLNLDR